MKYTTSTVEMSTRMIFNVSRDKYILFCSLLGFTMF